MARSRAFIVARHNVQGNTPEFVRETVEESLGKPSPYEMWSISTGKFPRGWKYLVDVTDEEYHSYRVFFEGDIFCCERFEPWRGEDGESVKQDLPPLAWLQSRHDANELIVIDVEIKE